jgi:L-ascorbate metabolism protein UlaG (beta-lactamase superfamily)
MKKVTIQKLEHAALVIDHNGRRIVVDPGSMTSATSRAKLRGVDAVLVTHKHGDHFDAAVLREIGVHVFGPPEVVALARASGLGATPLVLDIPTSIAGMNIIPVAANHGPAVTKPVENYGFIVQAEKARLYVTSDMAGSQSALPSGPFAVVALPVEGGGFVFDGKEASEFLRAIRHTGMAIALHADDAPAMRDEFIRFAGAFCKPVALDIGETVEI